MAVTLKLLKGPTLQRLVVLVLLCLSGLGHPPNSCEGLTCHCHNPDFDDCGHSSTIDCPPDLEGCYLKKTDVGVEQWCDKDGYFGVDVPVFKCIHEKHPGGSEMCLKGTGEELQTAFEDCNQQVANGTRPGPTPPIAYLNKTETAEMCACGTELCNSEEILGGGASRGRSADTGSTGGPTGPGSPGSSGTGAAQGVHEGRNLVRIGTFGAMVVTLLVSSGLVN